MTGVVFTVYYGHIRTKQTHDPVTNMTSYIQPNYLQVLIYLGASLIKEIRKTANGRWLVRYVKNGGNCCSFISASVFTRLNNQLLVEAVSDYIKDAYPDSRQVPSVFGWIVITDKQTKGYIQLINGMLWFGFNRNTRLVPQSLDYIQEVVNNGFRVTKAA